MNGNEHSLDVYSGKHKIAKLSLIDDQLHWNYYEDWCQEGYAVSPHLPLREKIPPLNVQRYLRNLLPEGAVLEELVYGLHLSKNNTFGLIKALGLDTSGALILLPSHQDLPQKGFFRPITDKELEERLDNRQVFNLLIWDGKPRLSVAGVQEKINIVLNPKGQAGFGEGSLCSTHILKFERVKLSHLVLNEYLSMKLAKHCGLNVAKVDLKHFGTHSALLVERFDRKYISGNFVKRRHMIDACQALNLPPDYKYERNFGSGRDVAHIRDGVSLYKLFEFADKCINPVKTKLQILDWQLFNILIFNFDAHGKNISFLVGNGGISLAPFYDLVNIGMYPEFEHDLAMAMGDEFDGKNINAWQLADFADTCKLSRHLVSGRLNDLIKKLTSGLQELNSLSINFNGDEKNYLNTFKTMIMERCTYLKKQSKYINTVTL